MRLATRTSNLAFFARTSTARRFLLARGVAATCAALVLLVACAPYPRSEPASDPPIGPLPSKPPTTGHSAESTGASETAAETGSSVAQPPGKPGYRLVFSDEFDGRRIDTRTWANLTPWNTRSTTGEHQYYSPDNTVVKDGVLTIKIEERTTEGRKYTSGIITSLNRPKFKYGYYEVRAKVPRGKGIWPAFWLTNDDTSEIDILEMLGGDPTRLHMTVHYMQNGKDEKRRSEHVGPDYSQDFHIYAVDWQPDHVAWYVDGVEIWRHTGVVPSDPMWMVLNTAVGGKWSGSPDKTTVLPQEFIVDYVRVYQRN